MLQKQVEIAIIVARGLRRVSNKVKRILRLLWEIWKLSQSALSRYLCYLAWFLPVYFHSKILKDLKLVESSKALDSLDSTRFCIGSWRVTLRFEALDSKFEFKPSRFSERLRITPLKRLIIPGKQMLKAARKPNCLFDQQIRNGNVISDRLALKLKNLTEQNSAVLLWLLQFKSIDGIPSWRHDGAAILSRVSQTCSTSF